MERLFREEKSIFSVQVDETAKAHLLETARWTRFLSLLYMTISALALIVGVIVFFVLSGTPGNFVSDTGVGIGAVGAYVVLLAIYSYPMWALYKFSKYTREALNSGNQQQFNDAMKYQKNMFRFMGILTLIVLGLYGVSLILSLLAVIVS